MTWQYNPERGDITDPNVPIDTLIILNPRYKTVGGEKVLDLEATARASVVVKGIGGKTK